MSKIKRLICYSGLFGGIHVVVPNAVSAQAATDLIPVVTLSDARQRAALVSPEAVAARARVGP